MSTKDRFRKHPYNSFINSSFSVLKINKNLYNWYYPVDSQWNVGFWFPLNLTRVIPTLINSKDIRPSVWDLYYLFITQTKNVV